MSSLPEPNGKSKPRVKDGRDIPTIFVHGELDDLPITYQAFRVYAHLARRTGVHTGAWPSYSSIGQACFRANYPNASTATLRRHAIRAVNELKALGLVEVQRRMAENGNHQSNLYFLTPRSSWTHQDP